MSYSRDYYEGLRERLKDPAEAAAYLEAALEEDEEGFFLALRNVAEAHGGVARIAKLSGLGRESLYKTLGGGTNPRIKTINAVLEAVGLQISFKPSSSRPRRLAAGH